MRTPERTIRIQTAVNQRQPGLTVVMENVKDPHNIMAALRTCDSAGVLEAHVIESVVSTFTMEVGRRSSTSARKWVGVKQHYLVDECYEQLRKEGKKIYTTHLDEDAVGLFELDLTQDVALVFGNERTGVSDEASAKADGNFHIPMFGMIKSLNISVACAITLYEAVRQRKAKGMYDIPQIQEPALSELFNRWIEM